MSTEPSFERLLEAAIYAGAFVDAFREMFTDLPLDERTAAAKREAAFVVECFRSEGLE